MVEHADRRESQEHWMAAGLLFGGQQIDLAGERFPNKQRHLWQRPLPNRTEVGAEMIYSPLI
jgi:hypothetical protein